MGPLEILWAAVFIFFLFIGLVRGYAKELGATAVMFAALFLITYFLQHYLPAAVAAALRILNIEHPNERLEQQIYSNFYSVLFIAILFSGYAGETFAFAGKVRRGTEGLLLNLAVGALNGYLVAGTLWYFQDLYNYPVADLKSAGGQPIFLTLPLTPVATTLVKYLPPYVIPSIFWGALVVLMLLLRIRR